MTRFALAVILLLTIAIFSGCGGGGGDYNPTPSMPYAGKWAGVYKSSGGQLAMFSLYIRSDGDFSGSLNNLTTGKNATLSGSVDSDGDMSGSVAYPDASYRLTGRVSINKSGRLVGSWSLSGVESGVIDAGR